MPEVGDPEKPKLVFFFDEAHLLFADIEQALEEKIEQVVRLIRSKGVGVYFVSQNPLDIPDKVLGQLGNRVQHALARVHPARSKGRADRSRNLSPNPKLKIEAVTELGVGEALVSMFDEDGKPGMVERAKIVPPRSRLGPVTPPATAGDRELIQCWPEFMTKLSIGSRLTKSCKRAPGKRPRLPGTTAPSAATPGASAGGESGFGKILGEVGSIFKPTIGPRGGVHDTMATTAMKSVIRAASSSVGREIVRGVLGGITGTGSKRR